MARGEEGRGGEARRLIQKDEVRERGVGEGEKGAEGEEEGDWGGSRGGGEGVGRRWGGGCKGGRGIRSRDVFSNAVNIHWEGWPLPLQLV